MSMKVTKILMDEHQVILAKLKELEELLNRESSFILGKIDYYFDFIKCYSDEYHHAKEEDIYFQWMIAKNPSVEFGPIKCMLSEHNIFRALVADAKTAISDYKLNEREGELLKAKELLLEFIDALRMHIDKEDTILYRMADGMDQNDGDELMLEKFMAVNSRLSGKIEALQIL